MTPQEINEMILLEHLRIRPEFFQHNGRTISDLMATVQRVELSGKLCRMETGKEYPCHRPAVVTHLESETPMCLPCFKEIEP